MKIDEDIKRKEFCLNFRDKETKLVILALKRQIKFTAKGRIPDMHVVKIMKMKESKDMTVKDFLIDHMPKKVAKFYFDSYAKILDKELDYYQFELFKCLPKITKSFHLIGFKVKKNQFELIVKRSLHISSVWFSNCMLETNKDILFDLPDANFLSTGREENKKEDQRMEKKFTRPIDRQKSFIQKREEEKAINYQTSKFMFKSCSDYEGDDWGESPRQVEFILEAISLCRLKDSLKEIKIED